MKRITQAAAALFVLGLGLGLSSANADAHKTSFLEACSSSPYIDETSDCLCIFNEVTHSFGSDDLPEIISYVEGSVDMDSEVRGAINFISGKCED